MRISELLDLQAQLPEAVVSVVEVNWGIDSSAVLVAADADVDTSVRAKDWLKDTTPLELVGMKCGWEHSGRRVQAESVVGAELCYGLVYRRCAVLFLRRRSQ